VIKWYDIGATLKEIYTELDEVVLSPAMKLLKEAGNSVVNVINTVFSSIFSKDQKTPEQRATAVTDAIQKTIKVAEEVKKPTPALVANKEKLAKLQEPQPQLYKNKGEAIEAGKQGMKEILHKLQAKELAANAKSGKISRPITPFMKNSSQKGFGKS